MENWWLLILVMYGGSALAAYLLGCFNGAVIVSKYILRDDVRNHGSGNAGLTNFYRTFGGPLTALVILTDVLKAVFALLLGVWVFGWLPGGGPALFGHHIDGVLFGKYWAGLFCLLGHMFPCMFKFKGGKGILSGGTIAIMIDWRIALVVWGGFLLLTVLTRYVSLGSVTVAALYPFAIVFMNLPPSWWQEVGWVTLLRPSLWVILLCAFLMAALVLWAHRSNIRRLLAGTENKLGQKKG